MSKEPQLKLPGHAWPDDRWRLYSIKKASLYMILAWIIPVVLYFILIIQYYIPIGAPVWCAKILFTILIIYFSARYFQNVKTQYKKEGYFLAAYWLALFAIINTTWWYLIKIVNSPFSIFSKVFITETVVIILLPIALGYSLEKKLGSN